MGLHTLLANVVSLGEESVVQNAPTCCTGLNDFGHVVGLEAQQLQG